MSNINPNQSDTIPRRAPYEKSAGYLYPHLAKEFADEMNIYSIYELYPSSKVKVWFKCVEGHHYQMSLGSRTHKNYCCNVCSGHVIITGVNDLKTLFPRIASEMDAADNLLKSSQIGVSSKDKIDFKCENGHVFSARIDNRVWSKTNCPYCCNQKVLFGYNDLATLYPDVAKKFDYEKNTTTPDKIIANSSKKYYFTCNNRHSYLISVHSMTKLGTNCKYCKRVDVWPGFNDLETLLPELAEEFDLERNDRSPSEVAAFSGTRKYWWKCKEGHSFQSTTKNRAYRGDGCIYCTGSQSSNVEKLVKESLSKVLLHVRSVEDSILQLKWRNRSYMKVDILGESHLGNVVAIEYDGSYWHQNADTKQRDMDKTVALLNAGYKVIRIRENGLSLLPINHQNLLQFNIDWQRYKESLEVINTTTSEWLQGDDPSNKTV